MTFGEVTEDPASGSLRTPHERVRETIELAKLADEVGLDVFGMGEHHRTDFVGSAPSIVLAAAAEATKQIRLTSAEIGRASCREREESRGGGANTRKNSTRYKCDSR